MEIVTLNGWESSPRVSIVVLNWNGIEDTVGCLESLMLITYPNYEIIVVDNGSEGKDVEILRERYGSYLNIIENHRNLGFAGGVNVGIKYAFQHVSDYVLSLNNDTTVDPRFLNELIVVAETDETIGAVGPKFYEYENHTRLQLPELYKYIGDTPQEMKGLPGIAFLVRRRVFEKVGLFDETFYPAYCEDVDFFERLKKGGYKLYCAPKSLIYHKLGASMKGHPYYGRYLMVKYRFLLVRRGRINGSYIQSFGHLLKHSFLDVIRLPLAIMRSKSPQPAIMLVRAIVEGVVIFIRNPKEKWDPIETNCSYE